VICKDLIRFVSTSGTNEAKKNYLTGMTARAGSHARIQPIGFRSNRLVRYLALLRVDRDLMRGKGACYSAEEDGLLKVKHTAAT